MAVRVTAEQVQVLMIAPSHARATAESVGAILTNESNARVTAYAVVAFVRIPPPPIPPLLSISY